MGWLGFRYVTQFTWVKKQPGLGQYSFGCTEPCLFGVRGATQLPAKRIRTDFGGPIDHERDASGGRKHSAKPRAILDQIHEAYPGQNVLEMFSRSERQGVESWGNETNAMPTGQASLMLPT